MKTVYELDDSQVASLHQLYQHEWWTKGRTREQTVKVLQGSQITMGLVDENNSLQAFCRVLTDYTFKAMIFDLIVSNEYRHCGFASRLIKQVKEHPELTSVKHIELYCLPELFEFYRKHDFSEEVSDIQLMRYTR